MFSFSPLFFSFHLHFDLIKSGAILARITRNETVIKLDHAYFGLEEVVPGPRQEKDTASGGSCIYNIC